MPDNEDKVKTQPPAKVAARDEVKAFLNGKEVLPPNVSGPDPEVWGNDRWSP